MKISHFNRNADILIAGGMMMMGYSASLKETYQSAVGFTVLLVGVAILVTGIGMLHQLIAKQAREIADLKGRLEAE